MRCLITACGGFIGSYLAEYLLSQGQTVYAVDRRISKNLRSLNEVSIRQCDILDRECVKKAILEIKPERIFHLASQTFVKPSWEDPEQTFRANVFGTLHILDAVLNAKISPTIEVVCSSSEYAVARDGNPIGEDSLLEPSSPYALSKLAQDYLASLYARAYGMNIIRLRPFAIIGPRKIGDMCSDFARGIVAIERGEQEFLNVGNLDAVRDFLDVRDAVAGLWLISNTGASNEIFNICSGKGYSVRQILERLIQLSNVKINAREETRLMRPLDEPIKIGDNSKLRSLGWTPRIPIDQTLSDILTYWRSEA